MIGFAAVILGWLWSARGIVNTSWKFVTGRDLIKKVGIIAPGENKPTETPQGSQFIQVKELVVNPVIVLPTAILATPGATLTPYPTFTPAPTLDTGDLILGDLLPGVYPAPDREADQVIQIKWSHYWPPMGGINGTGDYETMASGESWRRWVGQAVACPVELPLGTVIEVTQGSYWICKDRGGAIVFEDGAYWIDFLYPAMPHYTYWGYTSNAKVWMPTQ